MPNEQQEIIKQNAYAESMRYMSNAKETLQKSRKEDDHYVTKRHVRKACNTAYNGVLRALETYVQLMGVEIPQKKRKSIEFYESVAQSDAMLSMELDTAYFVFHPCGLCDGIRDIELMDIGFEHAYSIIERIKPDHVVEAPLRSAQASVFKQMMALFF
ncbi:hypothetical protein SAMD00024442_10_27 [Candidatus Symbiothrix dinenymphae]|nr:hypothetical protein SAMD00024442_10_27 [Candidatus Symbiothrix dinenymphae]